MEYISESTEETSKIAREILDTLKQKENGALVIGLSGELGAGKTTFMKAFAESLGIKETIQSPTFVIMKSYPLPFGEGAGGGVFKKLIHIDAYRLDSGEDLLKLGWKEIVGNKENLICIEWPELVQTVLTPDIMIRFEHGKEGENQRKISVA